jgi:hypothetical protein
LDEFSTLCDSFDCDGKCPIAVDISETFETQIYSASTRDDFADNNFNFKARKTVIESIICQMIFNRLRHES